MTEIATESPHSLVLEASGGIWKRMALDPSYGIDDIRKIDVTLVA